MMRHQAHQARKLLLNWKIDSADPDKVQYNIEIPIHIMNHSLLLVYQTGQKIPSVKRRGITKHGLSWLK